MYDIVFVGDIEKYNSEWNKIKNRFPFAKHALDIASIQPKIITEMFWVIWPDIILNDEFDFTYKVDEWSKDYVHVFKNRDTYDGVALVPKFRIVSQKESIYRFYLNCKEVDIQASFPKPYDLFIIDTYEEYLSALENSTTDMFWMSSNNIEIDQILLQNFYITHHERQLREQTHAFIHKVKDQHLYNGLFLCSKKIKLTEREIAYRFPVDRIEHDVIGSVAKQYDVFEIDTYEEYLHALETSKTEMFWMSSRNIKADIPDLYFTHDNEYDRKQNHVFQHIHNNEIYYNGLFLCSKHVPLTKKEVEFRYPVARKEWKVVGSITKEYQVFFTNNYQDYLDAYRNSHEDMFWVVPNHVEVLDNFKFDLCFGHHEQYDKRINHVFLNGNYHDGVILCSKKSRITQKEFDYNFIGNKKEYSIVASRPKSYDVVFISYQEPNADINYQKLLEKHPTAKRVHGVKGIHAAHIEAAKLCNTEMFFVVDGDAEILQEFSFDYQVPRWDHDVVHVWRSQNPINNLIYGYGGIKLLPRTLTINMDTSKPDMTTSISSKFKAVQEISNITAFNTDPFNTWKSAFRECVKLSSKTIDRQKDSETTERLQVWCSAGNDKLYGDYAILGALMGSKYGSENINNIEKLKRINDFNWLKEQFDGIV